MVNKRSAAIVLFAFAMLISLAAAGCGDVDGTGSPTGSANGEPTVDDGLVPVTFVVCEPMTQLSDSGEVQVAVVDEGSVLYARQACVALRDETGALAVRLPDGAQAAAEPQYVPLAGASLESIVWQPATGDRNGTPTEITGRYFQTDATVTEDPAGATVLELRLTVEGAPVFGSFTERIIGLPITVFIDGVPMRDGAGAILAPVVAARVDETVSFVGLTAEEATRLAELAQASKLR